MKIFTCVAGNTLNSHNDIITKLIKKGAEVVHSPELSEAIIVFCPIASRFESDIVAALSAVEDSDHQKVIMVAMHHTFKKNYAVPNHREQIGLRLLVDCLFHTKGLLSCSQNDRAIKMICKELDLKMFSFPTFKNSKRLER